MDKKTVILFTRFGLGHGPEELQLMLINKFLGLLDESNQLPAQILFYTDGVKLACQGSPVLDVLKDLENRGVELVLCKTCLDYYGLTGQVAAGVIGGMGDIIESLQKASKVISV
jgi:selenium metabolism protein YedF